VGPLLEEATLPDLVLPVILTREEARTDSDSVKRHVVSRPIPLEYLRVAEIHAAPQIRRERSESAGLLSFRGEARPAFPITFWHESNVTSRRYTFYAASESMRDRWQSVLLDAIVVRRTDQEANMVRRVSRSSEEGGHSCVECSGLRPTPSMMDSSSILVLVYQNKHACSIPARSRARHHLVSKSTPSICDPSLYTYSCRGAAVRHRWYPLRYLHRSQSHAQYVGYLFLLIMSSDGKL
jgi:hypothetical protein